MKGVSESSLSSRPANEREALVASHSSLSYTEEANKDDLSPSPDGNQLDCSDHSILSQFHEDAIRQADFGSYQWDAMVTIGLGLSADSIELFAMPYLLPQIEVDLCSNPAEKGWACAITFLGMIIGSLIWGSLGDQMGRKCILISALSVNFLFNTIAAFMPTYKSFITARFCSAIGVAGIYPIAMIYFSEFLPRSSRAKYVTWHLISWLLGGCYVLLLARIFLPKTGMDMIIESRQHVGGWRQFLLLCAAVPSIPAIIKLVFLSDSPRYLLESGRDVEAMIVYQEIFQKNSKKGQYQLSELELPGPTQSSNRSQSEISNARSYWNSLLQLFIPPHLKVTLLLTIFWFSAGFSYYGFTIWFPEKMQLSLLDEINKNAINTTFALYNGTNFYENLQNRHWNNSIFYNCNFANILLTDVTFDNCTFEKVVFTNISSIGAFFIKSSFANSRFIDTDISRENFVDCYIFNNSIQSNRKFCKNGFNTNIDMNVVFQENGARLIGSFVVMIMTGFYIGQISRTRIIGIALLLSSAGCLAMWILEGAQIIPFLIYNPIIMCALLVALCCANIAVIESYPTHLRSSGFCLMMFAFRSAGFLGVTVYHQFLSLSNSVAIFTTITVLMTAAVSVLKLPNSQTSLL